MKLTSNLLSRRRVLRGTGAAVSVPFFSSMLPAAATRNGRPPIRLGCIFVPNGFNMRQWKPGKEGRLKITDGTLEPLARHTENINVLSGINNGGGGHAQATGGFLTGGLPVKTGDPKLINVGCASVDQWVAHYNGKETLIPSLELGLQRAGRGVSNDGFSNIYTSHVSWKSMGIPAPHIINPRAAFNRLFRGVLSKSDPSSAPLAFDFDKSVLDSVLEQAKDLQSQLGIEDQRKLDEYLESVRDVERRIVREEEEVVAEQNITPEVLSEIQSVDRRLGRILKRDGSSESISAVPRVDHSQHIRLMLDIMSLAFWSDSTRVASFMMGGGVSGINMSFLDGVQGGHHSISHHKNDPGQLEMYARVNRYFTEHFAYLLDRLGEMRDSEGTVLENSLILYGSSLSDGNGHSRYNLPLVLAGRARKRVRGGRHINFGGAPIQHLHRTLADEVGCRKTFSGRGESVKL